MKKHRRPEGDRQPVLIGGPTASGKSALALAVAERDRGLVINADALQVYARWRVLTARPDDAEIARAPHALYGHVEADRYSAGDWLRDVAAVLAKARAAGLRPVIVGGTGLYFTALTRGLAPVPAVPPEIRERADALRADGQLDALSSELERRDPETWAAIDRQNPMRIQRAWEVLEATGRGLADWHRDTGPPVVSPAEAVRIVVNPPVAALNAHIAARLSAMVEGGALHEVRAALARGWNPSLPANRAIGAAELAAFINGDSSLTDSLEAASQATRQLAKRQRTWFRNRMADWTWFSPEPETAGDLVAAVPAG